MPLLAPPQPDREVPAVQAAAEQVVQEAKPAARLKDTFAGHAVFTVDTLTPILPPPGHANPVLHCVSVVALALSP